MAVAAQLYKWVEYPLLSLFTDNLKCTVHWYAYSLVKLLAIFSVLWRGLYFGRNLLPLQYSLLLLLLLLLFSRSVVSNPLATPWTGALQASLGFPRHEYWSRLPFPSSGVLLDLGIEPVFLALAGGFFTTEPPEKPTIISTALILQIRKVRRGGEQAGGHQSSIRFLNSSSPTAFIWPCWLRRQHLSCSCDWT